VGDSAFAGGVHNSGGYGEEGVALMLLFLLILCSIAFAQVQGETPALTAFAGQPGTYLIAMPTYTYSRMPGTLSLEAEEEIWNPDKWKDRRIFNRFVPIMDWKASVPGNLWFYTGNEIGDELWQELAGKGNEPNRTPMLYGGFATPAFGGFYAMAQFNQIDHFSEATFDSRRNRINSQKFSWFGENLPAYSGIFSGLGYHGSGDFFKNASILTGSEYLWAWNEEEWVPVRISPRVQGNINLYFMEKEVELYAATEKFQIQDSAMENRSSLGLRLKGENTGSGFYASKIDDKESLIIWLDFNHSFLQVFTNKGFIAFNSSQNEKTIFIDDISDNLEFKTNLSNSTDFVLGILLNHYGIKLYGETSYSSLPLFMKVKAYQNYAFDFESIGFDSEVAYKSRIAEAGAAYSREFFEYYRERIFYGIKPAERSAKLFLKYRFLENLTLTHEWIYRSEVQNELSSIPASWFWNAQIEQRIPKLNTSLYAVWLHALSKDRKDFSFGGVDRARFYCGINTGF
jgi:hypothetical protein